MHYTQRLADLRDVLTAALRHVGTATSAPAGLGGDAFQQVPGVHSTLDQVPAHDRYKLRAPVDLRREYRHPM
jgi:hypothetical protein